MQRKTFPVPVQTLGSVLHVTDATALFIAHIGRSRFSHSWWLKVISESYRVLMTKINWSVSKCMWSSLRRWFAEAVCTDFSVLRAELGQLLTVFRTAFKVNTIVKKWGRRTLKSVFHDWTAHTFWSPKWGGGYGLGLNCMWNLSPSAITVTT